MRGERSARIVTFYSYKGGTGRSMALANIAWLLAANGLRVLVIDWDLEAPGLHRYLQPFLRDKTLQSTEGLIDFIVDFATEATSPTVAHADDSGTEGRWYESAANLLSCAASVNWEHFPAGGTLDFVAAGRQDAGYAVRVNSFHWQQFYEKLGGGVFLEEVKRQLRPHYDYILIDSRTGVSDTSGICTIQMPDDLVVFFTLNQQSIEGASATAASAVAARKVVPNGSSALRVLPIPTRVDRSEKERLELALATARDRFEPFLDWLDEDDLDEYWGSAHIPYIPFYAYEEVLAAFGDPPYQTGSMLESVEKIAGWLTEGAVTKLPRQSEELRQRILPQFFRQARVRPAAGKDYLFFVNYSSRDYDDLLVRFLRDLTSEVSSLTGLPSESVAYHVADVGMGQAWDVQIREAMSASRALVAILSPAYQHDSFTQQELEFFGSLSKPVLPIEWVTVDPLPSALRAFQILRAQPGGLRTLMRLRSQEEEYFKVLHAAAQQIVALTKKPEDSGSVELAFVAVILAERRNGIRGVRKLTEPYGARRRDWEPFWSQRGPSSGEVVRQTAVRTKAELRLTSLTRFQEWLRSSLRLSGESAILLIDPWTAMMPEYRKICRQLTQHTKEAFAAVICLDSDAESKDARRQLLGNVQELFDDSSGRTWITEDERSVQVAMDEAVAWLKQARREISRSRA